MALALSRRSSKATRNMITLLLRDLLADIRSIQSRSHSLPVRSWSGISGRYEGSMYWYHAARVNATGTEIPACRVSPSGAAISSPSFRAVSYTHLTLPTNREV